MGSHREVGGAMLALVGFGFLVLAFKGTWHNVYEALIGQSTGATASSSQGSSSGPATAAPGYPGSMPGSGASGVPRATVPGTQAGGAQ